MWIQHIVGVWLAVLSMTSITWAAPAPIPAEYRGTWGAGGCAQAKYFLHVTANTIRMEGPKKNMMLGSWNVQEVTRRADGIIVDTQESASHTPTHLDFTKLANGHVRLSLSIGGNGGTDELFACR